MFQLFFRGMLGLCFPVILAAQSIAVPHSGLIFDSSSKVFRPILGVPGAAIMGAVLDIHGEMHTVAACSQQQFALVASGREGGVTLIHLDTLKTSAIAPALLDTPDQIQLSAGCSAAAIYSAAANRLQVLTGLPAKPVIAADLTLDLPAAVSSLAVSDDGLIVIAAVPGKAVYLVPAAGRVVALQSIERDAVVAMHGTQDAIVADQFSNSVTLIANAAGSPASTVLAGPDAGIDVPSGVWFDTRSQNVVVANSGNGKIALLPLAGGTADLIACECQLGGLSPLTDRTYELPSPSASQPLRMLDLSSSPPRVVFVASPEPAPFPEGRRK
jgi:hypothetical protein